MAGVEGPAASKSAADNIQDVRRPVDLTDSDMEWTFELPPMLKKKFQAIVLQLQALSEYLTRLDVGIEKKANKMVHSFTMDAFSPYFSLFSRLGCHCGIAKSHHSG
jgi:hypothetical protein